MSSEVKQSVQPGVLIDTYRIESELGAGAMGRVFKARDESLDRIVAIKVIRPELAAQRLVLDRFQREARAMAQIEHENVVEIFAYGEYGGAPYFVMEYIEGPTLEQWIESREGTEVHIDEALEIIDRIARGVRAIHSAGAVHRDLKPANVILGPASRVVVTDLGLVRQVKTGRESSRQMVVGSPAYLAPERLATSPIPSDDEHLTDVYSLGVIAFELLTGRLPFQAESTLQMLAMQSSVEPPSASSVRPALPSEFDEVIHHALVKAPNERVQGAHLFRQSLLAARRGCAIDLDEQSVDILLADDEPLFRQLTQAVLADAFPNATIRVAEDGAEAALLFGQSRPDLVVLDHDMPAMTGLEVTQWIREQGADDVSIVVITGAGSRALFKELALIGVNGLMPKSVQPVDMVLLVRRLLAERERERTHNRPTPLLSARPSSFPPPPVGSHFLGTTVKEVVGTSASGAQVVATDDFRSHPVAHTLYRVPTFARSAERLRLVHASMERTQITHPNLAPVLNVCENDAAFAVTSEWVEGESISSFVDRQPNRLTTRSTALYLLDQVAAAMGSFEGSGLALPVDPENVVVTSYLHAVALDSGLEPWVVSSARAAGMFFAPPESESDDPDTERAMVFSFAALAHFLLTGFAPPKPAGLLLDDGRLPESQREILSRALQTVPADRHPTVSALWSELRIAVSADIQATNERRPLYVWAAEPRDAAAIESALSPLGEVQVFADADSLISALAKGPDGVRVVVDVEEEPRAISVLHKIMTAAHSKHPMIVARTAFLSLTRARRLSRSAARLVVPRRSSLERLRLAMQAAGDLS